MSDRFAVALYYVPRREPHQTKQRTRHVKPSGNLFDSLSYLKVSYKMSAGHHQVVSQ